MSDVWSRRGYQREPSDTLQRLESPKEQMWQVFPGVLRMIGKCACEGVQWICPPIPIDFVPTCDDCKSLILWGDEE